MADPFAFEMPSLGSDMETGTLVEWLVKPGQRVCRGDVVCVIETHKGAIDVEIFRDGIVRRLLVEPGLDIPVGTVLAELDPIDAIAPPPAPAAPLPVEPPPSTPPVEVRASPAARRLARERGVDLAQVHGSGPHGAVRREDVEHAGVPTDPAPPPPRVAPAASGMRQAIAAAMARANREIPHYHLLHELDLSAPLRKLAERNRGRPPAERVLPAALLVGAVARALKAFPDLNGTWQDEAFRPATGIHPGIAIALRGGGVVTPAIHDADRLDPEALMAAMADLVARARSGRLRSSEVTDATITITSLGDGGADAVLGVIFPPQVALVGFGRVADRPVAVDGMLAVRPCVTASLSADHRQSDGHRGGQFLLAMERELVEGP